MRQSARQQNNNFASQADNQPQADYEPHESKLQNADHGEQLNKCPGVEDGQTPEQKAEEAKQIRRLQFIINMVTQVIHQDRSLPVEQASAMVANVRRAALAMFPDKSLAFDLIYWPRLQRLMRERYRMQ